MKTYKTNHKCLNCSYAIHVENQYGVEAPFTIPCPNCGLQTLKKIQRDISPSAETYSYEKGVLIKK